MNTSLTEHLRGVQDGNKILALRHPAGQKHIIGGQWIDCTLCGGRGLLKSRNTLLTRAGVTLVEYDQLMICPACYGIGMPIEAYRSTLRSRQL